MPGSAGNPGTFVNSKATLSAIANNDAIQKYPLKSNVEYPFSTPWNKEHVRIEQYRRS